MNVNKIIEIFIISTINLIQQRIFHYDDIDKMKLTSFQNLMKKLKKFVEKFAIAKNAKNAKVKMIWNDFFDDDDDDFVKINENEKTFRKFKKKNDFDDLNVAIKENDDYKNIEYETNEKIQKKNKTVENFFIINE